MSLMVVLAGVAGGILLMWLGAIVTLWRAGADRFAVGEAVRLLPDLLRLMRRLGTDRSLPWSVRGRVWLLLVYVALPVDLVPDFIPVIGFADDALLVAWVLRSTVRRAGPAVVEGHWPGTPAGLAAVSKLAHLEA